MPEEVFVIILAAIVMGSITITSIAKAIARVVQSRQGGGQQPSSLTRSELAHLLQEAVEEGTRPIAARLDRLERRLDDDAARLPEGYSRPALEEGAARLPAERERKSR